jgi:hypothetical protein
MAPQGRCIWGANPQFSAAIVLKAEQQTAPNQTMAQGQSAP